MDTSCCSLSVKVVFQHSSRLGNRPRCKVPFNQDIAFPSFTAISSDKASLSPNAQYQSLACAASLSAIQTQQENTFARASCEWQFRGIPLYMNTSGIAFQKTSQCRQTSTEAPNPRVTPLISTAFSGKIPALTPRWRRSRELPADSPIARS